MSTFSLDLIIDAMTVFGPALLLLAPLLAIKSILRAPTHPIQAVIIPVVCTVALALFFNYLPPIVEDAINHAHLPVNHIYHSYAKQFPSQFEYIDLHCDALLWGRRDLLHTSFHPLRKGRVIGHVDLPRLVAGRVKVQVFAAVNATPRKLNFLSNVEPSRISDSLVLKTAFERWPIRTWFSPKERVLFQFSRLHQMAKRSNGSLGIALSSRDLISPSADVLAIQAVEGLSCLEDNIETVDEFFNAGVRMMGPTHFFDTSVGGSLSGVCDCGLSAFGRNVMYRMKELNMMVDLAHASKQLMSDVLDLELDRRPALLLSHTGLKSVCDNQRNVDDEYIKRISDANGLIGLALFEPAQCGSDIIGSFVKSVSHAAAVLGGVDSIALGSDWDGLVYTSVSASDTQLLSSALQAMANFSESDVRRIMFENANKFLISSLPS